MSTLYQHKLGAYILHIWRDGQTAILDGRFTVVQYGPRVTSEAVALAWARQTIKALGR